VVPRTTRTPLKSNLVIFPSAFLKYHIYRLKLSVPPKQPQDYLNNKKYNSLFCFNLVLTYYSCRQVGSILLTELIMSYPSYISQYSPPSHSSSFSSSSSAGSPSNYSTGRKSPYRNMLPVIVDSSIAARYEAAKSFDLEDDLEYCPVLTIDEVHPTLPPAITVSSIRY
jgi:hypothetical protein